jgi:hypothetical protein
MDTLTDTDIETLFEKIAETIPEILHDPVSVDDDGNKNKLRFWGLDPNELVTDEKSKLNFEEFLLGLSLPRGEKTWNYADTGTISLKHKFFDVVVAKHIDTGDIEGRKEACEIAEKIIDYIFMWLKNIADGRKQCDWPVVAKIDLSTNNCRSLYNIGIGDLCGATIRLHLRGTILYNKATNPLEGMTP